VPGAHVAAEATTAPGLHRAVRARILFRMRTSHNGLVAILVLALPAAAGAQTAPRFAVELEGGPVWQTVNDVRIPNDASATRFSLVDLAGHGPVTTGRVYVSWDLNERHGLRLMAAPFTLKGTGVSANPVRFAGASYVAGVPVAATYRFDSYRLTWRYRIHRGTRWTWRAGVTAKIRSAEIALEQGNTASRKPDVGFVPLAHLDGDGRLGSRLHLLLDVDALAGGPGRAEDVALKLGYDVGRHLTLAGGYRTVEGGADVKSVYTFAWLHYAVLSAAYRF